jgi:hypothetical protein
VRREGIGKYVMEGGLFSALGNGKNSSLYSIEKVQNTAIMGVMR